MRLHGGGKVFPTELRNIFSAIKKMFLGSYGMFIRIRVFGCEMKRKAREGFIVAANHVTGADSIIVQIALKRRLYMLAARRWFRGRFLGFFMTFLCEMVPVDKHRGLGNLLGFKRALELLKAGECIGIYPSGRLDRGGKVTRIKSGAAYLAIKSGAPIVPVYISNLRLGPDPGLRRTQDTAKEGLGSVARNLFNKRIEVYVGAPIYPRTEGEQREEIEQMNAAICGWFGEMQGRVPTGERPLTH